MKHPEIKSKLMEYYDGELPSAEINEVHVHLADCSECRRELERWQKIKGVFFSVGPVEAPSGLVDNVMRRIWTEGKIPDSFDIVSAIRWLVPTVGVAFGILFFLSILPIEGDASISTEVIMLSNGNGGVPLEELVTEHDSQNTEWIQIVWGEIQ